MVKYSQQTGLENVYMRAPCDLERKQNEAKVSIQQSEGTTVENRSAANNTRARCTESSVDGEMWRRKAVVVVV
jgi:hypothetical protein